MSPSVPRRPQATIRAALAAANAVNRSRAAAYRLLPWGVSAKADWKGWDRPHFNPTPRQQALLDVVQDLLDGGETGAPLIALKVALRFECAEADILRSRDNVDNDGDSGFFYEDVLHALRALRAQAAEQAFHALMDRLVASARAAGH